MRNEMRPHGRARRTILAAGALALGLQGGACRPDEDEPARSALAAVNPVDFQQVELARGLAEMGEPISMAVLPDRSVLHTARNGVLRRTDANGNTTTIGTLAVYSHDEEGLQGVAVDPGFASNRFIYLYYAPPLSTPAGDAPTTGTDFSAWVGVNRLARFTLNADFTLNMSSQVTVLDVPADRGMCCHVGGDIDFDADGNLYLTTGDDTNPFESDGYAPIDERTNRNPAFDAQRTAANSNDLRGKLLRIRVNANGTYSIPAGNLFAPGTARTRPEIYAMGFRNPFRMSVDKLTGAVYIGDYGPDAGAASATRGPGGQVEFNRVTSPGNYGWPYCTGQNTTAETYFEFTFPTGPSSARYSCAGGPTNNSFRNTGLTTLPAARPAWINYDNCSVAAFGCGSESPMGGAVYRFNAALNSAVKFPAGLDGHYIAAEFGRRWLRDITVNANGTAGLIETFPWRGTQIIDTAFGPDGALYVLDYGTGFFNGDANSALYRIEYRPAGNQAPIARASANRTSGIAPLAVTFSSAGSSDPEGGALSFAWNFGDGTTGTGASPSHTYTTNGQRTVTLTVTDPAGRTGSTNLVITVGNTAPTVTLNIPISGTLFSFGDTVSFQVTVSDPQDGAIDCNRVRVTYVLGHDSHGHAITSRNGCAGSIAIPVDGEHDDAANLFAVFDAEYTDLGANGQPALTTHAQNTLQPRHRQAEHFTSQSGVSLIDKATAEGGRTVGDIQNGEWIAFQPYALSTATRFTARVSSGGVGGTLSVRSGSQTGAVLGTVTVPVTGGWENFIDVSTTLTNLPAGTTTLFLTFAGGAGSLFDVDSFTFGQTAGGTGPIVGIGGKCVDVSGSGTADGTKVQLWTCNGTGAQTWTRSGSTERALGKCLDISGGGTADNTRVQLWTCNGTGAQNWTPQANGTLVNPQSSKCLTPQANGTADGTQLVIFTCTGAANQRWTMP
jgi:glucose/arabinose dehydrogenase